MFCSCCLQMFHGRHENAATEQEPLDVAVVIFPSCKGKVCDLLCSGPRSATGSATFSTCTQSKTSSSKLSQQSMDLDGHFSSLCRSSPLCYHNVKYFLIFLHFRVEISTRQIWSLFRCKLFEIPVLTITDSLDYRSLKKSSVPFSVGWRAPSAILTASFSDLFSASPLMQVPQLTVFLWGEWSWYTTNVFAMSS